MNSDDFFFFFLLLEFWALKPNVYFRKAPVKAKGVLGTIWVFIWNLHQGKYTSEAISENEDKLGLMWFQNK